MRFFKRRPATEQEAAPAQPPSAEPHSLQPAPESQQPAPVPPAPKPEPATPTQLPVAAATPPVDDGEISVSRTLVKSEPELIEQVAANARLNTDGVEVTLTEKGFGTRVSIVASPATGASIDELESILDNLAESSKRPFSNI